jgi:hypothetical protein
MAFNKKMVPSLAELENMIKNKPEIVKLYINADMLVGPSDSLQLIDDFRKNLQKKEVIPSASMR